MRAKCYCLPAASIFVTNMVRRRIAVPDIDLESDQTTPDILLVFRGERPAVLNQHQILEVPPIMPEEEELQAAAVGLGQEDSRGGTITSSTSAVDNTLKSGKRK